MEKSFKNFAPLVHLDNVLLSFLKAYFKYHPKYTWSENDAETKIKIIEQYSEEGNENAGDIRIVIRRGNFSMTSATLGANDPEAGRPLLEWTQKRQKMYVAGSVYNLIVSTRIPRETLDLAEEISATLLMYKERISEEFKVDIKEHIEASTEELAATGRQKDSSSMTLTLTADYRYNMVVDIIPRYEKLKGVDLVSEIDKNIEKQNKIKFETLSFNTKVQ